MKNIFKLCALSIIIFSAAGILSAQQSVDAAKEADATKEFDAIYRNSSELRQGKVFRTKTTSETFDSKGTTLTSKNVLVYEVIPPDRNRYTSISEADSVKKKIETIQIGEKRYVRKDNGEWRIDDSKPKYGVGYEGRKSVKFIEKTTFNYQTVNVYEAKGDRNFSESSSFTAKYWFNEEGLLLKEESEDIFADKIVRRVSIYEYDANIKIETPVLSKETKP